jgi:hypothetical protein
MDVEDFFIDDEDWKFYQELPSDEQILFVYDLICEEFYGNGSLNEEEKGQIDTDNFQTFLEGLSDRLVNRAFDVSVLQINDRLIVNSEDKKLLNTTVLDYFINGFILERVDMSAIVTMLFHKLRYCEMYKILGKTEKINYN